MYESVDSIFAREHNWDFFSKSFDFLSSSFSLFERVSYCHFYLWKIEKSKERKKGRDNSIKKVDEPIIEFQANLRLDSTSGDEKKKKIYKGVRFSNATIIRELLLRYDIVELLSNSFSIA